MFQTLCILLIIFVLSSFSPLGKAMLNLTLPGTHPDPEAVAHEVHRYSLSPLFLTIHLNVASYIALI
jgi:hypothetical protein